MLGDEVGDEALEALGVLQVACAHHERISGIREAAAGGEGGVGGSQPGLDEHCGLGMGGAAEAGCELARLERLGGGGPTLDVGEAKRGVGVAGEVKAHVASVLVRV